MMCFGEGRMTSRMVHQATVNLVRWRTENHQHSIHIKHFRRVKTIAKITQNSKTQMYDTYIPG